jgi:peptidoglycan hydrolase CwlO-like protein
MFSRILQKESKGNGSEQIIKNLKSILQASEGEKRRLQDENKELREKNEELLRRNEQLHKDLQGAAGDIIRFDEMSKGLQSQLQQQITQAEEAEVLHQNQMKEKEDRINKLLETNRRGHEEHKKLLSYATDLKRKHDSLNSNLAEEKKKAVAEYRASPELIDAICEEFSKGYHAAMKKVQAAGIDPKSIDPEFEDDPPN